MLKWFLLVLCCLTLTACAKQDTIQGYVEGRLSYISSNFTGVLESLLVKKGDNVKKNQLLFILEPQPESDQSQQALSQLNEAKANLALVKTKLQRREVLFKKGVVSQEELDQSRADTLQVEAQVNASKASLSQAQWGENKKNIVAPKNAFVFDTYFLSGELVPANQAVLSLLTPQDSYIVFYLHESELVKIKLGQEIYITCDNCPQHITAKIDYISPKAEYTPPVVYTDKTREKLVYRIEALPSNPNLHPGQPVDITLWKK